MMRCKDGTGNEITGTAKAASQQVPFAVFLSKKIWILSPLKQNFNICVVYSIPDNDFAEEVTQCFRYWSWKMTRT